MSKEGRPSGQRSITLTKVEDKAMKGKSLDPKTRALLSLQAMMIGYPGVYRPQEYTHYVMAQLEKLKKAPQPWKFLDLDQYKTFQSLVVEHLGKERRSGKERRKMNRKVKENKRAADRRWTVKINNVEEDG